MPKNKIQRTGKAPYTKYGKSPHAYSPKLQQMLNAQSPGEYRRLFNEHSVMMLGFIPATNIDREEDRRFPSRRHR